MQALIERYLRHVTPTKMPKTQTEEKRHAKRLIKVFGNMAPEAIRPAHIGRYLDERKAAGAAISGNREVALLSHIFKRGMRWDICTNNPCRGVERNQETPRDRYVSLEELALFERFCGPMLRHYIRIKIRTGLRQQDILALTTANVRPEGLLVQPRKTKKTTAQRILFVWTPDFRSLFPENTDENVPILSTRSGSRYSSSGFQSIWRRAMDKFVEAGHNRFTEHDLRAVAASQAELQGLDSRILTGHATEQAHRVYLRHRVPAVAKVVNYEKS